jgi:hypothetical protein
MGGITLDDFTNSAIDQEIFGLSPQQQIRIEALSLRQLEALAEALLDVQGAEDLAAWLAALGAEPLGRG